MVLGSGDGGDDVSKWMFEKYFCYNIPKKAAATPERHPTPLGTTIVPRPPHTSALGDPGERTGADDRHGERGP